VPGNRNHPPRRGIAEVISRIPLTTLALAVGACVILILGLIITLIIALAGVNAELRARDEKANRLTLELSTLTEDYNTLRQSLGLPPLASAVTQDEAGGGDSALTQGLALIQSRYYDEQKARRFQEFKIGELFTQTAAGIGCRLLDAGLFSVALVKANNIYYSLSYSPDTDGVTITAAGVREHYSGAWGEQAAAFLRDNRGAIEAYYVKTSALKAALNGLGNDEKVAAALYKKQLTLRPGGEDHTRFWTVVAKEKEDLLTLAFDKLEGVFLFGSKKVDAGADLAGEALMSLSALDARTAKEKRFEAVIISLKGELTDPAFLAACREADMTVAAAPRETEEVVYFDIRHRHEKIGAFAVIRETADIYFVDKDDVQISALRTLAGSSSFKKKTSPDPGAVGSRDIFGTEDVTTFLVLGQNEDNADTTILVQADRRTSSLVLVSLPRDLFYRGARINKLPQAGFDHCAAKISELTGVPVSRYAAVDIYSLISLIDLLGGIDVELREDLVDPTYRIKENGVWQTLAYARGRYHFSGVQSLRVIRSRATTSDFNRSYRQQLVLEALLDKLKSTCGQDLEKAIAVFSRLSSYVTTNLSPLEVARDFFMFKDYRIRGRYVLDTSNILRHTYSMLYSLPEEEQEARMSTDNIEDLGAWILLPRNNDWDLLRSYIKSLLSAP
jgi:LCP family protein required for cell wall assembly